MKIDFIIPGFSKCGTTTLADMLGSHPDVFMCPGKEPGYFAENYSLGWQWYEDSFVGYQGERSVSEASTTYSSEEFAVVACERILQHSPNCKFIFLARDPVNRMESSYREMHASGDKYGIAPPFDFAATLDALPNIIADTKYWRLINHYRKQVQDSQIHVLFLKDLKRSPAEELNKCFAFLGLDAMAPESIQLAQLNPAETKTYDTHLYRFIRTSPLPSRLWAKLSPRRRQKLVTKFSLKKPFNLPVVWSPKAIEYFEEHIRPEATSFLQHYGKSPCFWNLDVRERQMKPPRAA